MISTFIVPQIALAAWWNPFSWSIWNIFRPTPHVQQVQIAPTPTLTATSITTTTEKVDTKVVSTKKPVVDSAQKVNQPNIKQPSIVAPSQPIPTIDVYAKYRDPATGKILTPEEFVKNADAKCASQDKVRSGTINSDGTISCITYTQACQAKFGINSYSSGAKECDCTEGYAFDSNNKCIVIDYNALCQKKYGVNSYSTGKNSGGNNTCGCKTDYNFNQSGTSCQLKQTTDYNNAPYRQDGNAYSPEQLNAMDCAWYGINCPTINVRILN